MTAFRGPKLLLFATISFLLGLISSCRKEVSALNETNLNTHDLAFLYERYDTVKIGQAVVLYDASLDRDSNGMAILPIDKYYEWKITPDNGCATVSGKAYNGSAQIAFSCSGTYQIFANIYDSVTHELFATTKKVELVVTTEKLLPKQAVDRADTLYVEPSIVNGWTSPLDPQRDPPDYKRVFLKLWTKKLYDYGYNQLEYTTTTATNRFSFTITDSVKSLSYPFLYGKGYSEAAGQQIDLPEMKEGVPATILIEWLGKKYSGTITYSYVQASNSYVVTKQWESTDAVIIYP